MGRPCPAALTVAAAAVGLAAADIRFHRRGDRLVTDVLRTPAVSLALLVLVAHVLDVLGPLDPFRVVARLIPQQHSNSWGEGDTQHGNAYQHCRGSSRV